MRAQMNDAEQGLPPRSPKRRLDELDDDDLDDAEDRAAYMYEQMQVDGLRRERQQAERQRELDAAEKDYNDAMDAEAAEQLVSCQG